MSDLIKMARAARNHAPVDPETTRGKLIAAAERLIAAHGIEGVSLRTICADAGQGNKRALQYHFVDRAGIIHAIMLDRMHYIESRRAALLSSAVKEARPLSARAAVEGLLRPMSETLNVSGKNIYARFLAHVMTHTHQIFGGDSDAEIAEERDMSDPTATERFVEFLVEAAPHLSREQVLMRLAHILRMFVGAIVDRESTIMNNGPAPSLNEMLDEQFEMAAAGICAKKVSPREQHIPAV